MVFFFMENQSKDIFAAGVILDSIGPVSAGRGGTNISHADNGVLIHDNPAGLVRMPHGLHLAGAVELIYHDTRYEDPLDTDYSKHEIFTLPTFSLIYNTCNEADESGFAFGLGYYVPAGFSTEYDLKFAGFTNPSNNNAVQRYSSDAQLNKLLFSVSYKVTEDLSVGFSAGPTYLSLELEAPYTFQTGGLAGNSGLINLDADRFGFSYSAGMQYNIPKINTTVGLSFVSESKATLKGHSDVLMPDFGLGGEYDVKTNFEWPRSIGFGISHLVKDAHRFSADVVWFDWASAYDRLHLELTDGDNTNTNLFLKGAVGSADLNDSFPLDWEDVFVYRFGYEFFFNKTNEGNDSSKAKDILRVGYIYNENPIPNDTLVPLVVGTTKHNFNYGYTHKWEHLELNSAFEFALSDNERVGKSSIVGGDFDNSELKTKVYTISIGFAYHF